jgi:hypothetical protein
MAQVRSGKESIDLQEGDAPYRRLEYRPGVEVNVLNITNRDYQIAESNHDWVVS